MKVPPPHYEATVAFYRDVLGFVQLPAPGFDPGDSVCFEFGGKVLWIDRAAGLSQAEIWLEIVTDDVARAAAYFADRRCTRRDGIEPLPEGFKGFWLANPADIIHLVAGSDE